jgi:glucose-1-phosphate adenylyltransferase
MVSPGVIISGARVNNSVVSPDVRVHSYSEVDDSVLLDGVDIGRNCRVKRAIIDKNVRLPENTSVGLDAEQDRARGFTVTESGITVVGKGTVLEP